MQAARGLHPIVTDTRAPDDSTGGVNAFTPTRKTGRTQPPRIVGRRDGPADRRVDELDVPVVGRVVAAGGRTAGSERRGVEVARGDAPTAGDVPTTGDGDTDVAGVGRGVGSMTGTDDTAGSAVLGASGVAVGDEMLISASPSSLGENEVAAAASDGPASLPPALGVTAGATVVTTPNTTPLTRIAANASSNPRGVRCTTHHHRRPP